MVICPSFILSIPVSQPELHFFYAVSLSPTHCIEKATINTSKVQQIHKPRVDKRRQWV